jgi:hypothetical protein
MRPPKYEDHLALCGEKYAIPGPRWPTVTGVAFANPSDVAFHIGDNGVVVHIGEVDDMEKGHLTEGLLHVEHPTKYPPPAAPDHWMAPSAGAIESTVEHVRQSGRVVLIKDYINSFVGSLLKHLPGNEGAAIHFYFHNMRALEKHFKIPIPPPSFPAPSAEIFRKYVQLRAPEHAAGFTMTFALGLLYKKFYYRLNDKVHRMVPYMYMGFFWLHKSLEVYMSEVPTAID